MWAWSDVVRTSVVPHVIALVWSGLHFYRTNRQIPARAQLLWKLCQIFASGSIFSSTGSTSVRTNTGTSSSSGNSFILVIGKCEIASAAWCFTPAGGQLQSQTLTFLRWLSTSFPVSSVMFNPLWSTSGSKPRSFKIQCQQQSGP